MAQKHWQYNDNYIRYSIDGLKSIPTYEHFAIMIVDQRSYSEAGYDRNDPPIINYHDVVTYYAFPLNEKTLWQNLINEIYTEQYSGKFLYKTKPEIIIFKSSGRGEIDMTININVKDLPE